MMLYELADMNKLEELCSNSPNLPDTNRLAFESMQDELLKILHRRFQISKLDRFVRAVRDKNSSWSVQVSCMVAL